MKSRSPRDIAIVGHVHSQTGQRKTGIFLVYSQPWLFFFHARVGNRISRSTPLSSARVQKKPRDNRSHLIHSAMSTLSFWQGRIHCLGWILTAVYSCEANVILRCFFGPCQRGKRSLSSLFIADCKHPPSPWLENLQVTMNAPTPDDTVMKQPPWCDRDYAPPPNACHHDEPAKAGQVGTRRGLHADWRPCYPRKSIGQAQFMVTSWQLKTKLFWFSCFQSRWQPRNRLVTRW